jgi:hypothetical protein
MSEYNARVIHDPLRGWQKLDRVSIGVSMGNPSTDGDKFRALVKFVNAHGNFKKCLICVSDTLAAWNETDETCRVLPDAIELSRRKGDEWLKRNSHTLEEIAVPFEIVRWDRWRQDPQFAATLAETSALYDSSISFREAVNADTEDVVQRRSKGLGPEFSTNLRKNSVAFFLEEIAGYRLFYQHYKKCAKIYPGSQIRSFMVADTPPELKNEYFMQLHIRRMKGASEDFGFTAPPAVSLKKFACS